MSKALRILQVMSGSNVVHQLLDSGVVEFNRASNTGAFSVSGSVTLGPTTNNILSGTFMAGLFRVPHYTSTGDASLLTTLAGSGLAAGNYNGQMFYMSGSGLTSGDATAVSYFSRGDCLYFCRNGSWFPDMLGNFFDENASAGSDTWTSAATWTLSFENNTGWTGTTATPNISGRTFSASSTNTETFEQSTGFNKTFSDVDLSSFSDSWTSSSESLSFTSAEGFTSVASISGFSFSAEATAQLTYEVSNGFNKTFSDVDLSSFSNGWSNSSESLAFTTAEGFTGVTDISSFSFSADTTAELTYETSTGFNKTFTQPSLASFSNTWGDNSHIEEVGDWS